MTSSITTIRRIASLTAALSLSALLFVHPQLRAERIERSAIVRTHDLDLSRPEGQARLDRRIAIAARRLCRDDGGTRVGRQREIAACRTSAVARTSNARSTAIQRAGAH